jgi:purine-binding chemotaxis protein CheW
MQRQLITFEIDGKMLAVDIMAVREIRAWTPTTPIPNAPPFVRGVVNLRGLVLPVIDLSERLGWGLVDPSERNVIIVVEIEGQMTGLIVGSVNDIVTIDDETIQPPPNMGSPEGENLLEGLAPVEDRMAMILKLGFMGAGAAIAVLTEAA